MNKFFESHTFSFQLFKQFTLLFFLIIPSLSSQSQLINNNWQNLFEQSYYSGYRGFAPLKVDWLKFSNSDRITDLQPLSYGLDAILAMYETTDSICYIDDAITITNNNIKRSQVTDLIPGNRFKFKDSYRGWIEDGTDTSSVVYHTETELSEIYFYQYVSRLLKDIHNNRKLYKNERYRNFYNRTLDFIEINIWDKWESRGEKFNTNKYYYFSLDRSHMASHWTYTAAELYFLTKSEKRKSAYLAFVNLYNSDLESNFHKYDKYISWNQTWYGVNHIGGIIQDVSHGNLVVSYIVEAYDLGLWKDSDAVQRIVNTLKDKLWDPQDCLFRDNIDGTMFELGNKGSVGSFQGDGFVKLTRYDKSLFSIYEKFVNCSKLLTAWSQYGQLFANLALSEKVLKGSG